MSHLILSTGAIQVLIRLVLSIYSNNYMVIACDMNIIVPLFSKPIPFSSGESGYRNLWARRF